MSAIYDALANAVLASDGAMGTMLQDVVVLNYMDLPIALSN